MDEERIEYQIIAVDNDLTSEELDDAFWITVQLQEFIENLLETDKEFLTKRN